ncbi:MAG: class I SAM-dependent methyltransferase [Anaerolineae bacterium]
MDRVTGQSFDILRCCQCGLRYTSPRPPADELAVYYPQPLDPPWLAQIVRRWLRRRRAQWSAAGQPPGRALEIGCGDGWMLNALRQAGWEVVGTERSEESAARPRNLGLDVRVGNVDRCGFPAASFDLVILWHALEHLDDPLATLIEARRIMCPTGRLVVAVPNADSWQARVAGRRWVHLDVPRHLYHFGPETLAATLERAGFSLETWSFSSLTYECRGWWDSPAACVGSSMLTYALAGLLLPFAVTLSTIAAYRKASAAMTVRARPTVGNA